MHHEHIDPGPGRRPAPAGTLPVVPTLLDDLRLLLRLEPELWPETARPQFVLAAAVDAALLACAPELAGIYVAQRVPALTVRGTAEQITRVLVHLLRNAAHATRALGRARVIRVDARPEGARARVRVSDNGRGIDAPALARMFEPFFSQDGAGRSLGLGLTLGSAIVRAHGGRLRCANRQPHGACFEFDLALATDAPSGRRP